MPTLCFGGSFNPIHLGHLVCAQAVAQKAGYDRVRLIPSGQPPHKIDATLVSSADRLAMCRLVATENNLFEVDDIETRRAGPSFTIDTAQELRDRGFKRIDWLIGADMLLYLPKWHRPLDLLREVNFIIMARPGWTLDWSSLPAEYRHLKDHVIEAPLIEIGATDIRARVARDEPIDHLVPPAVARYIADHGLYRR
jgi:nicotinate-nucleotide adenylyltransferase